MCPSDPLNADAARSRLLLVEDEQSVARVTDLVLRTEGYQVDIGQDLSGAQAMLAANHYDLVLADTDQGARTRDLGSLADFVQLAAPTPVVLFSAHRFSHEELESAGLVGAITKPYDVDDLLRKVTEAIGRASHAPAGLQEPPA
jgi:DNA-binding response OmpR family regulator